MPVQVTIIGLGRIGGSISLALGQHNDKIFRVGHDKNLTMEREAQKRGVTDKTEHNLPRAVQDAQIVILSLPISEIQETLEFIIPDLKPGTVVLDTAPVKAGSVQWAKDHLPEEVYYVGLVPAIAAEFLGDQGNGLDSAKADLFSKSIFFVNAPAGTPGDVVQLASDFVHLLGAEPMLTDILESDGLITTTHILPQLTSVALLNTTLDQPGWSDARKIASRVYSAITSGVDFDDMKSLQMLSLQNRENMIRALDALIASLNDLRDDLESENEESFKNHLESARRGREIWLNERAAANWTKMQHDSPDHPSLSERLFGPLLSKRVKKKE